MSEYRWITRIVAILLGIYLVLGGVVAVVLGRYVWQLWLAVPAAFLLGSVLVHAGWRGTDPPWIHLDDDQDRDAHRAPA